MASFLSNWVAFAAAYLICAGQVSPDELAAAAACGLVAALWATMWARVSATRFRPDAGVMKAVFRGIFRLPGATAQVAWRLVRALAGNIRGSAITEPPPVAVIGPARNAASLLGRSLAPDSFVLRAPDRDGGWLVHDILTRMASQKAETAP